MDCLTFLRFIPNIQNQLLMLSLWTHAKKLGLSFGAPSLFIITDRWNRLSLTIAIVRILSMQIH